MSSHSLYYTPGTNITNVILSTKSALKKESLWGNGIS